MSLFQKLKDRFLPSISNESATNLVPEKDLIRHEYINFPKAFRIGILCYYIDYDSQKIIGDYKKKLENLGYECEVLMYIDKKERENNIYLQFFDQNDLDKKTNLPHSPRTDRFIMKRYDMLINLYTQNCNELLYISKMSQAKCRIAPFINFFKEYSDVMILNDKDTSLESIILHINNCLNLKPYERKQI